VALACLGILGIVALITAFLVWVSGHPVAWSVVGFLFAAAPLTGLLLALGVGLRAAVAAGPGWIGVRILRHWSVLDLGQVRTVRMGVEHPFGGFGPFRGGHFGPFGLPGGGGPDGGSGAELGPGPAGSAGPASGPADTGPMGPVRPAAPPADVGPGPARALVLEDVSGGRIELDADALESGLADVVRRGLNPNAEITPDAARALGDTGHTEPESGAADRP
jgi:hypothetical protein